MTQDLWPVRIDTPCCLLYATNYCIFVDAFPKVGSIFLALQNIKAMKQTISHYCAHSERLQM